MNTGGLIPDSIKLPATGTSQRIVPESNRYRWEQQWLKENRDASEVIYSHCESMDGSGPIAAASKDTHRSATDLSLDDAVTASLARGDKFAGDIAATKFRGFVESLTAAPISATSSIPSVPLVPIREAGLLFREVAPTHSAALGATYKDDIKQFALWRSGDEIKISMRLSKSDTQSATALSTLRLWLKDLRLKLSALIINGNVQWQVKPRNKDGY